MLTLTLPRATADSAVHSYSVMADAWGRFRDRLDYSRADRPHPGMCRRMSGSKSLTATDGRIDTSSLVVSGG